MRTAVIIPCYNEAVTITKVINDFRVELPQADIYVYDNNSKDATYDLAQKAGATVHKETRQGKGNVVRTMFREIEADYYVLVDGDDTYPADSVKNLLAQAHMGADVVVGDRLSSGIYKKENKRDFHSFGNNLVRFLINRLFGVNLKDIMSGYRVFSKDFVKNYPVLCAGFQLETDMTIFALDRNFTIKEIPITYRDRPSGSYSKLNTYSDGVRVIITIFNLFRYYKPFLYFSSISVSFLLLGLIVGTPVVYEYIEFQYIQKVPSAILAAALISLASFSFMSGVILDAVKRSSQEDFELGMKKFR
jgi:glycosyltransferase involved in cell wall biosynthesis